MADATPVQDGDEIVDEGPWSVDDPEIAAHKYAAVLTDISPSGIVEASMAQWFDTPDALDEYFDEVTAELKDDFLNDYADFNVFVVTKVKTEAMDKHMSYRVIHKPEQIELAKSIRKRLGTKRVGDLYTIGADLSQSDEEFKEVIKVAAKDAAAQNAKAEQLAEVKPKTVSKSKVVKGGDRDQPEATVKPKVVSKGKRSPIQQVDMPNSQFSNKVPVIRSKGKRRPQAS